MKGFTLGLRIGLFALANQITDIDASVFAYHDIITTRIHRVTLGNLDFVTGIAYYQQAVYHTPTMLIAVV